MGTSLYPSMHRIHHTYYYGPDEAHDAIRDFALTDMDRWLDYLESQLDPYLAGAAPMVGFLGTVIGMVNVFLDMEAAGTVQVSDISSGTKQAMVTTIVGLIVGILAFMAYNHLVSKVSKVVHRMEANSLEFIDILEEPARG